MKRAILSVGVAPAAVASAMILGCSSDTSSIGGGAGDGVAGSGGDQAGVGPAGPGPGGAGPSVGPATTGTGGAETTTGTGGESMGGAGPGGAGPGGGGPGGGPPMTAVVYAHSPTQLYKLDPITKAVALVGPFNGCNESVIDIAVDKSGNVFGTTWTQVVKIDPVTANCVIVAQGSSYPNSLSFVPQGTVDPNEEALVGFFQSSYVRIDKKTGQIQSLGQLGGGYSSSGDLVSIINGGTYLTVNGNNCFDCLVSIDPKTGALLNVIGNLGYGSVYGLTYWDGLAYGFTDGGLLFEVDVMTGMTKPIPIPNAPPGLQFWGAGSTTAAPVGIK
jgi:hypothetical protein